MVSPLFGAVVGFLFEAHPVAIAIPSAPDATIAHFIAGTPLLALWDVQLRLDRFLSSFIGRAPSETSMNRNQKAKGREFRGVIRIDHLNLRPLCR
jgi:hypothetical protein